MAGHPTTRRRFIASGMATAASLALGRRVSAATLKDDAVAAIEFRTVSIPWPRHVGRNSSKGIHGWGPKSAGVCVLHSKAGAAGWGHIQGSRRSAEALRERVIGRKIAELIDPASGIAAPELHPIDVPLHDLAAVALGMPVWKMISGAEKQQLTKVYSGMIYFDDLEPAERPAGIDKVLENCRADREMGYRQFKVKIGRGNKWMLPLEKGLRRDIDVIKAIHDAFPDCEILVDGNNGFDVDTFIKFLEGIEGVPLFWIEEPFHETVADWSKLADWLIANGREKTWRADGEARPDFPVLEELEDKKKLNLRLNDICGYGFSKWRQLLPKLKAKGVAISPHTWGSALKTTYTAHFAAAYGNTPTVEGVSTAGGDVDFGENKIVEAQYRPSSAPGFGLGLPK